APPAAEAGFRGAAGVQAASAGSQEQERAGRSARALDAGEEAVAAASAKIFDGGSGHGSRASVALTGSKPAALRSQAPAGGPIAAAPREAVPESRPAAPGPAPWRDLERVTAALAAGGFCCLLLALGWSSLGPAARAGVSTLGAVAAVAGALACGLGAAVVSTGGPGAACWGPAALAGAGSFLALRPLAAGLGGAGSTEALWETVCLKLVKGAAFY
ncbi:MAG: hypothetical protein KGJ45_10480, partial [Elusimicrobia bacterium]|nr:hypothetical protein [Elusimicrobiota bacterium]